MRPSSILWSSFISSALSCLGGQVESGKRPSGILKLVIACGKRPSGILQLVISCGKRPSSILWLLMPCGKRPSSRLWFVIDSGKLKTSSKIAQLFKITESGTLQRASRVLCPFKRNPLQYGWLWTPQDLTTGTGRFLLHFWEPGSMRNVPSEPERVAEAEARDS